MIESRAGIEPVVAGERETARMIRSIGMHALAAALMFVSPFSLFVPAAFISAGLRNGRRGAWGAVGVASALLALFIALTASSEAPAAGVATIVRLVLEVGAPAVIATFLIRRATPGGQVLMAMTGASIGGFAVGEVAMRALFSYSPYEAIVESFRTVSQATIDIYRTAGWPEDGLAAMAKFSTAVADGYVPALLLSITVVMFAVSLVTIPRLPAGRATGEGYLFRNLVLPDGLLIAFVLAGLSPLASGALRLAGLNLLVVVGLLYTMQGLAVFRMVVLRSRLKLFGSLLVWTVVFITAIYGIGVATLFLIGLFDSFFDFRQLKRKDHPDESNTD